MHIIKKLNTLIKRLEKQRIFDYAAFALVIIFITAGILVSVNRYWQYESFYYDLGIFDTAIWKVAHFQAPIIDHVRLSGKWIFADHFSPTIFLFSPLYWITDRREVLLIAQAVCVGISGLVLYYIGKLVTKSSFISLSVLTCYFLFVGLQNAIIADFHELTFATLFFMLSYLAILKNKKFWFWISFFLLLLSKETLFLAGIGIAISLYFMDKKLRKTAKIAALFSLMYGVVVIKLIIPHFATDAYIYDVPTHGNIFYFVTMFFNDPQKIKTMFSSFYSFGFLPLLSPSFWFLILQDFFVRFYSPLDTTRWGLGFHYSAMPAAIMAVGSLFSLKKIIGFKLTKKYGAIIAMLLILNAVFLYRFVFHAPFGLAYNKVFYAHTKDLQFLNNLVARVPKNGTVMTQNNLAVRFTHNPKVWVLRKNYRDRMPQYIVIDNRPGQNPSDFYLTENVPKLLAFLEDDPEYKVTYKNGDEYIYQRSDFLREK